MLTTFSKHSFGVEGSTPNDITMFVHNNFTTWESCTELQIHSVVANTFLTVSLLLLTSSLKDSSVISKILIKSSHGEIRPALVRADMNLLGDSVDFIACNKTRISSLQLPFFFLFVWWSLLTIYPAMFESGPCSFGLSCGEVADIVDGSCRWAVL